MCILYYTMDLWAMADSSCSNIFHGNVTLGLLHSIHLMREVSYGNTSNKCMNLSIIMLEINLFTANHNVFVGCLS